MQKRHYNRIKRRFLGWGIVFGAILVGTAYEIAPHLTESRTWVFENKNHTLTPFQSENGATGQNDANYEAPDPCGLIDVICDAEAAELPKQAFGTVYNAEEAQTDADPLTMANGKQVREGIVASNCYPFGTKIAVEGMGVFEVEDRMNSRYTEHCGKPLVVEGGRWVSGERMDFFKWDREQVFAKSVSYKIIIKN